MSLRTQYEFLFVGRDEDSFVENYAYDLGEGGENSGKIFINLEIQNNPAEAEDIGELIFDTLRKRFFSDPDEDPYVRFEKSLKDVNRELKNLRLGKPSHFIGNLHVIIAAIVGDNLLLTQCGEAEAYLIRRKFCSVISDDLYDPESKDFFTNIANGTVEPEDFILLSSTRLLRYINKNDFARIGSSKSLVGALGELRDFLSAEVLGKMGFIGIRAGFPAELTDQERSKVVSHLQKEEKIHGPGSKAKQPVNVILVDAVKKLSESVKNLSQKFALGSRGGAGIRGEERPGRVVRGGQGGGLFSFSSWSRDKILGAIIIIIIVLVGGVWWLRSRADEQTKIDHYVAILSQVQEEIGSAETTGQYNKDQASQMLNDAEQQALGVLNSGYARSDARKYLDQIQATRDKLDGVIHPLTRVLADLSAKRANVSALGLLSLKGSMYVFEYNALYPILADKVLDPLTIDENETVIAGSAFDDQNSLLFYTKSGKVIQYKDNRMAFVQSAEGSFHKGVAVQAYNNKFYILDPDSNQIWKYTKLRDKFDSAQQYNVDGDLKNGVSFAIDGNVYVVNKDGSMTKLLSGNKQNLVLKRQPVKPLSAPVKIFTELDLPQVYILEPSTHRVMVYYKDDKTQGLTYQAQYVFDDLNDLRDLYYDKNNNKLYLMDASKVYEVDLNQTAPATTTTVTTAAPTTQTTPPATTTPAATVPAATTPSTTTTPTPATSTQAASSTQATTQASTPPPGP